MRDEQHGAVEAVASSSSSHSSERRSRWFVGSSSSSRSGFDASARASEARVSSPPENDSSGRSNCSSANPSPCRIEPRRAAPRVAAGGLELALGEVVRRERRVGAVAARHARLELGEARLGRADVGQALADVAAEREAARQRRALVVQGDAVALGVRDAAGVGLGLAREHAQERRLARAVASDQRQALARRQRERDVGEDGVGPEAVAETGRMESGHTGSLPVRCPSRPPVVALRSRRWPSRCVVFAPSFAATKVSVDGLGVATSATIRLARRRRHPAADRAPLVAARCGAHWRPLALLGVTGMGVQTYAISIGIDAGTRVARRADPRPRADLHRALRRAAPARASRARTRSSGSRSGSPAWSSSRASLTVGVVGHAARRGARARDHDRQLLDLRRAAAGARAPRRRHPRRRRDDDRGRPRDPAVRAGRGRARDAPCTTTRAPSDALRRRATTCSGRPSLGYALFVYAVARLRPSLLAVMLYALPPLAVLADWVLIGERPHGRDVVGRRADPARSRDRDAPRAPR